MNVDLDTTIGPHGVSISEQSLIKWLKNEIDISSVNMQACKEELKGLDETCDTYRWTTNRMIRSEAELNAFNHLLMKLGHSYYKGK